MALPVVFLKAKSVLKKAGKAKAIADTVNSATDGGVERTVKPVIGCAFFGCLGFPIFLVLFIILILSDIFGTIQLADGATSSSSGDVISGSVLGTIEIPEEFGHGGFVVTYYHNDENSEWDWIRETNQGKLYYDYWLLQDDEDKYDNGIATYGGRYLMACTETFGQAGDMVDFYLDDGTKIPCIIADIKAAIHTNNKWGHSGGQNIIEFEVSRAYMYNEAGGVNPGNGNWFPEWGGKRVTKCENLGPVWDV